MTIHSQKTRDRCTTVDFNYFFSAILIWEPESDRVRETKI